MHLLVVEYTFIMLWHYTRIKLSAYFNVYIYIYTVYIYIYYIHIYTVGCSPTDQGDDGQEIRGLVALRNRRGLWFRYHVSI